MKANKTLFITSLGLAITLTFLLLYLIIKPVRFDNLGGTHIWLTGSTIKFTNMWLEEGASNLYFTSYESFNSIEFNDVNERHPYVSYPPGTVLFTYTVAKICGLNHIDVSFIKHLQFILFLIECICWGILIFLVLGYLRIKSNLIKAVSAYLTVCVFMILPDNAWYLLNVFYADILVLFFVTIFFLLEFLYHTISNKKTQVALHIFRALIIFCGIFTDYYFWILAFLAWGLDLWRNINLYKSSKYTRLQVFLCSLTYILPALVAVILYVWQLSTVENGFQLQFQKYLLRTGQNTYSGIENQSFIQRMHAIYLHFCGGYRQGTSGMIAMVVYLLTFGLLCCNLLKDKGIKQTMLHPVALILMCITIAPIAQIFILNNHSAPHEFSILKVAHPITLIVPLVAYLCYYFLRGHAHKDKFQFGEHNLSIYGSLFLVAWLVMVLIMGLPQRTNHLYNARMEYASFPIEEAIHENTQYEDVLFSYTYALPFNPPDPYSVSEKNVYFIQSLDDINTLFPALNPKANKLLLIEKHPFEQKTDAVISLETQAIENGVIRYEDENILLVFL